MLSRTSISFLASDSNRKFSFRCRPSIFFIALESKLVMGYMRIVLLGWGSSGDTLIFKASTGWCWARWYWWTHQRYLSDFAIFKNYSSWCTYAVLSQALLFSVATQTPPWPHCPPPHGLLINPASPSHLLRKFRVPSCWALAVLPRRLARLLCFWYIAGSRTNLWGPLCSVQGQTILIIFWSSCLGRLRSHWSFFLYSLSWPLIYLFVLSCPLGNL